MPYFLSFCIILISSQAFASSALHKIAFGSCNHQDKDQSLWPIIESFAPELWIWSGDVIYADTKDPKTLSEIYQKQKNSLKYQQFSKSTQIIGTWDDHDYGDNDSDKTFPIKEKSQQLFLDFLDEPEKSPRRLQQGIYWHQTFGVGKEEISVFLLDARYHKDTWGTKDGTILGSTQWDWLQSAIKSSRSSINIIVSSIQVIPDEHPFEKWANFPKERLRLLDLLASPSLKSPIIISGDRHIAEISDIEIGKKKIWEITSSGITHSYKGFTKEANRHRVGVVFYQINFGSITIDWKARTLDLAIHDEKGKVAANQLIKL